MSAYGMLEVCAFLGRRGGGGGGGGCCDHNLVSTLGWCLLLFDCNKINHLLNQR